MLDDVHQLGTGSAVSNTLVPAARAKVSLRVPPGTDAGFALQALTQHLTEHAPWGAQVTVAPDEVGQSSIIDVTGPVHDMARASFRDAWDGT